MLPRMLFCRLLGQRVLRKREWRDRVSAFGKPGLAGQGPRLEAAEGRRKGIGAGLQECLPRGHAKTPPRRVGPQALLFAQTGPYSSRVFTSVPSCPGLAYSPALFRVLLLRRLRLPLPFTARSSPPCRPLLPACPPCLPTALAPFLKSSPAGFRRAVSLHPCGGAPLYQLLCDEKGVCKRMSNQPSRKLRSRGGTQRCA